MAGGAAARSRAILLYTVTANRQIIVCGCEETIAAGVRPGMTLAHARALLSGLALCLQPHEPWREAACLRALALWARRFSPLVAVDPPDGLLVDISGCQRLFGGEKRLLQQFTRAVGSLGFQVRAALASTAGCAWALARFGGDGRIVEPGEERDAVAGLPVQALRLEEDVCEALRELSIDRIGQLCDLPRADLAARCGGELLRRLDQALGSAPETITAVRSNAPIIVERTFDAPSTQIEGILLAARGLVDALAVELERRESGATRLELTLQRVDVAPLRHVLVLSYPSRDAGHLWALLQPKVEQSHLGFGVERIRLSAEGRLLRRHQVGLLGHQDDGGETEQARVLGRFIDALKGRCGPRAALRAELVESHVPERAFRLEPVETAELPGHPERRRAGGDQRDSTDAETEIRADRPPLLLSQPEPVQVMSLAPDGPPAQVIWRDGPAAVVTSLGPERLAEEWWRVDDPVLRSPTPGTRDYYAIEDERGRWLWIYRNLESGAWFIHGVWA